MKKINQVLQAGCLMMMVVLGVAACASTPTQESTGQYLDSSLITTKVKTALLNEKGLHSHAISVKTYKGTVQLSGFVDSAQQAQLAEKVTARVKGVQAVKNDLVIKQQETR